MGCLAVMMDALSLIVKPSATFQTCLPSFKACSVVKFEKVRISRIIRTSEQSHSCQADPPSSEQPGVDSSPEDMTGEFALHTYICCGILVAPQQSDWLPWASKNNCCTMLWKKERPTFGLLWAHVAINWRGYLDGFDSFGNYIGTNLY